MFSEFSERENEFTKNPFTFSQVDKKLHIQESICAQIKCENMLGIKFSCRLRRTRPAVDKVKRLDNICDEKKIHLDYTPILKVYHLKYCQEM